MLHSTAGLSGGSGEYGGSTVEDGSCLLSQTSNPRILVSSTWPGNCAELNHRATSRLYFFSQDISFRKFHRRMLCSYPNQGPGLPPLRETKGCEKGVRTLCTSVKGP